MRFKPSFAFFTLMLTSTLVSSLAQNHSHSAHLNALNIKKNAKVEQISIDLSSAVSIEPHFLRAEKDVPYARYYIDFKHTELAAGFNLPKPDQNFKLLKGLRAAQKDPQTVRVVFELDPKSQQDHILVENKGPHVLVYVAQKATDLAILQLETLPEPLNKSSVSTPKHNHPTKGSSPLDIETPSTQTVRITAKKNIEEVKISTPKVNKNHRYKIIIDPGHGGEDPGAHGPFFQTKEKDVTLSIAKLLKKVLDKDDQYMVLMTRDDDKSLQLLERTNFANQQHGDLFVSIHANANTKHSARGVSTYFLHNADDEESLRVAMRENGELALPKAEQKNQNDAYFLEVMKASMLKNFHTVQSTDLARTVQYNLFSHLSQKYSDVYNRGVKSARFYVLTGANMPAILVETSFITNKMEEKRLRSQAYQEHIALAIYRGVQAYFKQQEKSLSHARMY